MLFFIWHLHHVGSTLHTRTWRWGDRVLLCLRSNESFSRCCLDLYGPDLSTPAGIFWGYIEKMRFPGGLVSEIWELQWEIGTMRMRESARVGPGQGWPALCCLPHNNSSERASVPWRKNELSMHFLFSTLFGFWSHHLVPILILSGA